MSAVAPPRDEWVIARDLAKTFWLGRTEVPALRGISLSLRQGEFACLTGPSGSGKTVTLHLLAALDRPSSGELTVAGERLFGDGRPPSEAKLDRFRRRHIGLIFSEFFLVPTLTATENVMLPMLWGGKTSRGRAAELLDMVGLSHRSRHYPAELSGGEMQRVAIARALVNEPSLLLADEPTGNLDTRTRDEVFAVLAGLVRDQGMTVLVATHDWELAERIPRVVKLADGLIVGEERHGG